MEGFNNSLPYRSRGRGSQGVEKRDLRRPHDMSQANQSAGDMLQSPLSTRPSSSTMPNYAAVVAGGFVDSNAAHARNQNTALLNTTVGVNSSSRSITPTDNNCSTVDSTLSPFAEEFVPQRFREPTADDDIQDANNEPQTEYIVDYLNEFIYEVTMNPGKFDRNVGIFVDNLKDMIHNESSLTAIVNTIMDQATREANFRYNAARLCNQLCASYNSHEISFRRVLLNKCAHVFINRESEAEQDIAKLRGFTFFLGELYSQIKVNEQRIETLSEALPSLFETLLNHPSMDNFKCVCQMMKFTGPSLEDDEKARNKGTPSMDQLIHRLETSVSIAPREVQNMMSSVIQLRSCNWGRAVTPPITNSEPIHPADLPTEAVFYGPDGVPISSEEALFLENAQQGLYNSSQFDGDDYGDDDDDDSEGMDEEISAAFEEFLLQSGQKPT